MPTATRTLRRDLEAAVAGAETVREVARAAHLPLCRAVGADVAAWGTVDPGTVLNTSCILFADGDDGPVSLEDDLARERRLFELEWAETDPATFTALVREGRAAAALRHEVGDAEAVVRYREVLAPMGIHDEIRLVGEVDGSSWATIAVYRFARRDFTAAERDLAGAVMDIVARAFRRTMLRAACAGSHLDDPPGALLVDHRGGVITTSEAAEALLSEAHERDVVATLINLAVRTTGDGSGSATLFGSEGPLVLHASPAKGADGVSVIVERPRPVRLAALIMDALELTERERQVAELSVRGFSRTAMARTLGLGEHTVGDHLKHIFAKAGVGGRAELAARLFGDFYASRREAGLSPGPYGFFLD